jgi:DNA-binding MarR family transcriptional regulator
MSHGWPGLRGQETDESRLSLSILVALARRPSDVRDLREASRLSAGDFESVLTKLLASGIIARPGDARSTMEGPVSLTEEGERVLLLELEQMCELPEVP